MSNPIYSTSNVQNHKPVEVLTKSITSTGYSYKCKTVSMRHGKLKETNINTFSIKSSKKFKK